MPSITCQVINKKGLHARAAASIVQLVSGFQSKVTLSHKDVHAPADSLLKLLTLNAPKDSLITIEASGSDEAQLLKELKQLFNQGFGE